MDDYDLEDCLIYNPQEGFNKDDVKSILAVWEGQNDGDDWRWVLELNDGRFVYLQGGCDFTGWDCQSWASHIVFATPEECAMYASNPEDLEISETNTPVLGLGRMLNILSGQYMKNTNEVSNSLMDQIAKGKKETWREKTDKDMPDLPKIRL